MGGKYIFQDQNLACLSTFGRHFLGQVDADLKGRHHDEIPNLFKIKTCSRNAGGLWLNFFCSHCPRCRIDVHTEPLT